jgi:GTP-binding protein Era
MTDVPPHAAHQMTCGFVALIGAPNAGKSTLLNTMVGAKVSIVSRKVQTTRTRITGIAIEGDAQIIFVDTPGIFAPKRRLDRAMVETAWLGVKDADCTALLIDVFHGITDEVRAILKGLKAGHAPRAKPILVLNKVDLVKKERLLELTAELGAEADFAETFMISALNGSGVADLKKYLAGAMQPGPWLYPEDQISDISERLLASEITREKLYERLHDEIPYVVTVETEHWQERADGSARIEQVIYIERESHKPIVLGKGGRTVKAIGKAAREELEELLGRKVHLFIFVKLREKWQNDPERYRMQNLPFNV